MAKSLGNREDVQSTSKAAEGSQGNQFLSIPDQKTPWRLVSLDYADSFVHWVETDSGRRPMRCGGGVEGEGFKPDKCPVCAYMLQLYQDAKALRLEGEDARADKLKAKANDMRGNLQVVMKVVRGQYALMKDPKTGKKYRVADWDSSDDDSEVEVGLIGLSKAQWNGLTDLIDNDDIPHVTGPDDLLNRTLFTSKERRKGKNGNKYSAVVWGAEEEESDFPDVEIPKEVEEINLDDFCEIDFDELNEVYRLLSGESVDSVSDDEDVALEEDSEDEPSDDYLDDVDDDDDSDDDSDDDDDDFEDDLPFDDDEDAAPVKKSAPKTKRPVKSTSTKRSGKTRL